MHLVRTQWLPEKTDATNPTAGNDCKRAQSRLRGRLPIDPGACRVDKKAETTQPLQRRRAGEGCGANVNSRRANGSTVCDWQATVVATGLADLSRLSCG